MTLLSVFAVRAMCEQRKATVSEIADKNLLQICSPSKAIAVGSRTREKRDSMTKPRSEKFNDDKKELFRVTMMLKFPNHYC